ncbi:ATP-binding protein [Azospirillum sp. RWY-5-1]|uniref:ATP-binding protein n=1 Tax=Azospirillum oleiclasticum TaxID=2735135 RepID=A0ABX2TFW4_9PROT|nr:ATP-binding protein [Azospirillum oleiclasticum]NYZ15649.1 ATP-binding protein [Azospirillum oleiclasticum]NYZ21919.1 ATP-binding protein [Azospirillum oleiclasticum]
MLEITQEEVVGSLAAENPWWDEGKAEDRYTRLPRRGYFRMFFELIVQTALNRAVVLMGPRRVGKTVMMQHAVQGLIDRGVPARSILYVSIDAPTYTGMHLEKFLHLFFERNGVGRADETYVLFDEVQYLKDWQVHLKSLVDRYPNTRFVASGSAAAALKRASNESGAGRFTDFLLPPLTFVEYLNFIGVENELITQNYDGEYELRTSGSIELLNAEFVNYINYGGYPEAVLSDVARGNPSRFIKSDIIDKVLLRDLPSLYGISDIQELNKLFTSVAYNTGNAVSLEKLSQSSGVSKPTISRYLDYLEAAFLITRLRRIDEKGGTFAREREFKVYLTNPSMRAALFQPVTADSEIMGQLVETAIVGQWLHSPFFNELAYARWKRSKRSKEHQDSYCEVDLVRWIDGSNRPFECTEIKWSDRFVERPEQLEGLLEFCRKNSVILKIEATTRSRSAITSVSDITIQQMPSALKCYTIGREALDFRELIS